MRKPIAALSSSLSPRWSLCSPSHRLLQIQLLLLVAKTPKHKTHPQSLLPQTDFQKQTRVYPTTQHETDPKKKTPKPKPKKENRCSCDHLLQQHLLNRKWKRPRERSLPRKEKGARKMKRGRLAPTHNKGCEESVL